MSSTTEQLIARKRALELAIKEAKSMALRLQLREQVRELQAEIELRARRAAAGG